METKTHFIGTDGEKVVDTTVTRGQIGRVTSLGCALRSSDGEAITWGDVYDPDEPRSLFSFVLQDRKMRVDDGHYMADRPPFAVLTEIDGQIVHFEFYEGHDVLALTYDLRSPELVGQDLPLWMEADPYAYDPAAFLRGLGFPEEAIETVKAVHP